MHADLAVTAALGFNEAADDAIALPAALLLGWIADLFDEMREQSRISLLPKQHAIGGKTVASRTARFLVILLDRFRQREMDHSANGGFIDPQAKGDGADQHADFVGHPSFLVAPAGGVVHLAVVADGFDSGFGEQDDGLFDARDGGRVNDYVSPA